MNTLATIGDRIVSARASQGMTQLELATALGVAATQLSRYELNKVKPRPEAIHRIAKILDVSPEWLSSGAGAVNEHELSDPPAPGERDVTVELDPDVEKAIRHFAKSEGLTVSGALREIVERSVAPMGSSAPSALTVTLPPELLPFLAGVAKRNGKTMEEEASERLRVSLESDARKSEGTPNREWQTGVRMADEVPAWTEHLMKPENREELQGVLGFLGDMLDRYRSQKRGEK
ncbi:helix-turn-helix domain-containing protein [Burkholderia gladioli]|uniref:helix-turn-helix domain-containing protein n=1 Tax=Burkholderia gladioli TaxID=28095 RepID=UPI001641C2CA|nr:helix-turn-helix domain-containing protein [Burkholderia gladioli]